ncbi:MAG: bifunctional folylpolyglutamate synthase/dihydrofolate synthase [Hungatella sp.]|nr:bifunctional folylpolyglutamate synthase/dihydrofolate synthase [Hungatella sp.]
MTEAEKYLDEIPMWASKKNSLQDIRCFLERMGNPDRAMNVIHVAGTNGKGSVCAYLISILKQAGYHTAAFISPHLIHVRERFLHDGRPAGETEFLRAFEHVKELSQVMAAEGYARPAYFEFLFYMFMDMGRQWKPDFVILETGLGGLLDTTNTVEHPLLTVITSISMDHMQYLGDTVQTIAAQKAGILKPGVPVVYDGSCRESRQVIEERAEVLCCPAYPVADEDLKFGGRGSLGIRGTVKAGTKTVELLIPSRADYQLMNAALAFRAAQVIDRDGRFKVSVKAAAAGIRTSRWPGRMEEVLPGVFLDGAHNEGGMEALARNIAAMQRESGKPVSLMFGVVGDKEYRKMIRKLCGQVDVSHVTVAQMDTERSVGAAVLAEEFRESLGCPVEAFDTVKDGWKCFLRNKGEGLAFCAGSLYLAGEVKALLDGYCLQGTSEQ